MVIDASALAAILLEETEAGQLVERMDASDTKITHPVSVYEAVTALARERNGDFARATTVVTSFLLKTGTLSVEIGRSETMAAIEAFSRYGRGRHPARLNMGDCFSYGVAQVRSMPLLYKGDDFTKTDLA